MVQPMVQAMVQRLPAPRSRRVPLVTMQRTFLRVDDEAITAPSPDAGSASYLQFAPRPELRDFVECVDMCRERIPAGTTVEERVLPDGAAHLLFNLTDPPSTEGEEASPVAGAIGATTRAQVIRMTGLVDGVGVRLRPGGLARLLGVPAGELAGRSVALDDLRGARTAELMERLAAAPYGAARAAVVERALLALLPRDAPAPHAGAARAVAIIHHRRGLVRVRDLAAGIGVGERRLGQLFHEHVGLTPKALCRLVRFRAAVSLLLRGPERSLSTLAHECGYADHPHLVHDFREIAGLTPGALRAALDVGSGDFGFPQDRPGATPQLHGVHRPTG